MWAVVLGGFFAFQNFKAHIISQVMASMANPPQTVSTDDGRLAGLAAAGASRRQPARGERRRSVAGSRRVSSMRSISTPATMCLPARCCCACAPDDDVAKLQALQATADLAQITYDRDVKQLKAQAISQAIVDNDNFNLKNARAQVEQQKAMVDKKTLRAPFAGHLGIRAVDLGQYLNAGHRCRDVAGAGSDLRRLLPAAAGAGPDQDRPGDHRAGGYLSRARRLPGRSPRSIRRWIPVHATCRCAPRSAIPTASCCRACLRRWTSMSARRSSTSRCRRPRSPTIRMAARSIWSSRTARRTRAKQTFVTTGATRGDQVAVLTGVKEGDAVVTAGQMKLHNGSPVTINNSVQPDRRMPRRSQPITDGPQP